MYTPIHLTFEQATETLIFPDWKTLGECCNAYLRLCVPYEPFAYTIFAVDHDGARRRIAPECLVGELALDPNTQLIIGREVVDAPTPALVTPSGQIVTATALHCSISINPNQRISVPTDGLSIDRNLVQNALSRWQQWGLTLRSCFGSESPLNAVAKQRHCVIAIDPHHGQWVLRAIESVVIEGRFCGSGSTFLLPPATTLIRLGTNGPAVTIDLEMP